MSRERKALIIRAQRMWSADKGLEKNVELVIQEDRISEIRPASNVGCTVKSSVIDLTDATLVPGLIDCHVHLGVDAARMMDCLVRDTTALIGFRAADDARRCLLAGFTTLRAMEGRGGYAVALRDAILEGYVEGPRILASGRYIQGTGGHADMFVPAECNHIDFGAINVNGADEARKAVRENIFRGADFLKLVATGGVLSAGDEPTTIQMSQAEIEAAVEEAKAANKTVAVHAHARKGVKISAKAGVTSIEHATYADEEALQLMRAKSVYLVPTFLVSDEIASRARNGKLEKHTLRKIEGTHEKSLWVFKKAKEMGVRIAFGTDLCFHDSFGTNARELELMVGAGMDEGEALTSVTQTAANCLGLQDHIGTLSEGKVADIVAFPGNPLQNIAATRQPLLVITCGRVVLNRAA